MEALAQKLITDIRAAGLKAPAKIIFGAGVFAQLEGLAQELAGGRPVFIVTSPSLAPRAEALRRGLPGAVFAQVQGEPTIALADAVAAQARRLALGLVISLGGGSVMDTGKAVAALAVNPGSVRDYLEGLGQRTQLAAPPLPHLAVPTTAGTGAEATRNAVIAAPDAGVKRSMRFDGMLPAVALLDPALTLSVPRAATAAGGLDTLTQLLEVCISTKRKPAVTALALQALTLVRTALPLCCAEPDNLAARSAMMLASFISGVGLANAGLAMAHGIAAALGALYAVPHGLACGILLPATLRYNRPACEAELAAALAAFLNQSTVAAASRLCSGATPGHDGRRRRSQSAATDMDAIIETGIAAIEQLQRLLDVPGDLRHLRLDAAALQEIAAGSMGSSMSGNPVPMNPEMTLEFLRKVT
jgi:alcohol dehydrogenase class IV